MKILDFGILVVDIIAAGLPGIAEPGKVIFTPRGIKTRIGGHAANFSIDEVKIGLNGKDILVIGAIGYDIFGKFIEETLKRYGVLTDLERIKEADTSKNIILVVKGEDRRFHVDIGANIYLSVNHIIETIETRKPQIIYVGATGWLGKVDDNLDTILSKAEDSTITFVDPIAPYGKDWKHILPALKYTDIFHCNDIEASMITDCTSIEKSGEKLLKKGVKMVLITMGEKGLYARTSSWSIRMNAFKVDTVDPTGAGDAFSAGVIYKLIEKNIKSVEEISVNKALDILVFASAAGASATLKEGTTEGVVRETIYSIIKKQGKEIMEQAVIEEF